MAEDALKRAVIKRFQRLAKAQAEGFGTGRESTVERYKRLAKEREELAAIEEEPLVTGEKPTLEGPTMVETGPSYPGTPRDVSRGTMPYYPYGTPEEEWESARKWRQVGQAMDLPFGLASTWLGGGRFQFEPFSSYEWPPQGEAPFPGFLPTAFKPITEANKGISQILGIAEEKKIIPKGMVPPVLKDHMADFALIFAGGPAAEMLTTYGARAEHAISRAAFGDAGAAEAIKAAIGRLSGTSREKAWRMAAKILREIPKTAEGKAVYKMLPEFSGASPSAVRTALAEASEIRTPSEARAFIDRLATGARKAPAPPEAPPAGPLPVVRPTVGEGPPVGPVIGRPPERPLEAPEIVPGTERALPTEEAAAAKAGAAEAPSMAPPRAPLPSEAAAPAAVAPKAPEAAPEGLEAFITSRGGDIGKIRGNQYRTRAVIDQYVKEHPNADPVILEANFARGRQPGETLDYSMEMGITPGEPVRIRDIAHLQEKTLRTRLNVKLRGVQRLGNRFFAAAGKFARRAFGAQVRKIDDLETLMHEFGHGLEIKLFGEKGAPEAWKPVQDELVEMGRSIYGDLLPDADPKWLAQEGFAEFLWMLQGKPEQVATRVPQTFAWWTDTIVPANPKLAKQVSEVQRLVTQYRTQGPENRVLASFAKSGEKMPEDPIIPPLKRKYLRTKERHWDEAAVLKEMQDQLGVVLGPYETFGAMRGTAGGRAGRALTEAQLDLDGNFMGPSALDILRKVLRKGQFPFVQVYHRAKHGAQSLMERGIETGAGRIEDLLAIIDKYENTKGLEHIVRAQQQITRYLQNEVMLVAREQGSGEMLARFFEQNPFYLPLRRNFPDLAGLTGEGGGGSFLARRKGSTRLVNAYMDQIRDYTHQMRSLAVDARIKKHIVRLKDRPGAFPWIHEVEGEQIPAEFKKLSELEDQLRRAGADVSHADPDALIEIWTQQRKLPGMDTVFAFRQGDDMRYFRVHPDVYREMQACQHRELNSLLNASRFITNIQRTGITGIRGEFALRNFWRDFWTSLITDPAGRGPGLAHPYQIVKGLVRGERAMLGDLFPSLRATKVGGKIMRDPIVEVYRGIGQDMSSMQMHDRDLAILFKRMASQKISKDLWNFVRHPVDTLRVILGPFESASRLAQVEKVIRARGMYGKPMMLTEADTLAIATAAAEVSTNFRRMGTVGRYINMVRVFHNAQVQGMNMTARTFRARPARTTVRGMAYLTVPTLGLWYINRDNPDYQRLPVWRRVGFWNIPVGKDEDGSTKWVHLPIPFEFGLIFKALPESIANWTYLSNKDDFRADENIEGFVAEAARQLVPLNVEIDDLPSFAWSLASNIGVIAPLADIAANKRWPNRPLAPRSVEDLPKTSQELLYTTATAKWVAKFLTNSLNLVGAKMKISPLEVDHLIRGYTGGAISDFIQAAEAAAGHPLKDEALLEAADQWLIGTFFSRAESRYGDLSWIWDRWGEILAQKRDADMRLREQKEGWKDYQLTGKEMQRYDLLEGTTKELKELHDRAQEAKTLKEAQSIYRRMGALAERTRKRLYEMENRER